MKNQIQILAATCLMIFLSFNANAQEIKNPMTPKAATEIKADKVEEGKTWVKAHWEWTDGEYAWVEGKYVDTKDGYAWIDGQWERDRNTGWWVFNSGYWKKENRNAIVVNNGSLSEDEKITRIRKQENMESGFFIKTAAAE